MKKDEGDSVANPAGDCKESKTPAVSLSPAQSSLITFFFQFQTLLQALGTAPAIDYSEYSKAAIDMSARQGR